MTLRSHWSVFFFGLPYISARALYFPLTSVELRPCFCGQAATWIRVRPVIFAGGRDKTKGEVNLDFAPASSLSFRFLVSLQAYFFTVFTIESCYISRVIRLGVSFSPRFRRAIPWILSVSAREILAIPPVPPLVKWGSRMLMFPFHNRQKHNSRQHAVFSFLGQKGSVAT